MNPKICLITGATSGLGKAAALALAEMKFQLILIGRNEKKIQNVCSEIRRKTHSYNFHYYCCDISLLQDVRRTADLIRSAYPRIDVLINNAGARFLLPQRTSEGVELTLATNHLGPYVLTLSLIPSLAASASARIIQVSSGTHYSSRGVIKNVTSAQTYDGRFQYAQSKLANILFTYALAEKLNDAKITVNAVDPGGVATNFARNNGLWPWLKHRLYYLKKRKLLTPAQGAQTIVFLASSAAVEGNSGKYYYDLKERRSSPLSYEKSAQIKLWELSVKLGGIDL
jgi:NAD(P)-dependent dehydrogenase (short-subunit alcohol dehydrogenase family)